LEILAGCFEEGELGFRSERFGYDKNSSRSVGGVNAGRFSLSG
jgi:hypothetical protein